MSSRFAGGNLEQPKHHRGITNYTFSGSLIPPLVMIYVASRSGQSTSCEHRHSTVGKMAYLVNRLSLQLALPHDLYGAKPLWSRRGPEHDRQRVYARQHRRIKRWLQGQTVLGLSPTYQSK